MTSTVARHPDTGPAALDPRARQSTLRSAGLGGILAFVGWLLQPLLVLVLVGDEERTDFASLEETAWTAGYEVVTFVLVGTGMLLLVHGVDRLGRERGPYAGLEHAGLLLGRTSAIGWFGVAAVTSAPFSSASTDLEAASTADQTAVITGLGVVQMTVLLLVVLCGAAWLATVATSARRRGVVGRPTAVVAGASAVLSVSSFFVPFAPPWGAVALPVVALVLGVQLLLRSRRA